ncbi:MAG: pyridoxal phosphate-dependent aminotransferase, partial [Rubrobacteraceae bacterium]
EYERASRLCGARVARFEREVSPGGTKLDVPALCAAVREARPRVVWLCDPNNPTGDLLSRAGVEAILEGVAAVGGLLALDEAYRELVLEGEPDDLVDLLSGGNLVLLRSATKAHSIAGLRLGYAISEPTVTRTLSAVRPPWNVSGPAQAAGVAALSPPALRHLEASRKALARDAAYLRGEMSRAGFRVLPGVANFLLVEVSAAGSGASVRGRLLAEGMQIRDCASFGLPDHVRVAVRRRGECERLAEAFTRLAREAG